MVVLGTALLSDNSFAKEMSVGETKVVGSDFQIVMVQFKGMEGRNCIVDIEIVEGGREVFSNTISFDWEREERKFSVGKKEFLIFYVVKGLVVYIDDKEI